MKNGILILSVHILVQRQFRALIILRNGISRRIMLRNGTEHC